MKGWDGKVQDPGIPNPPPPPGTLNPGPPPGPMPPAVPTVHARAAAAEGGSRTSAQDRRSAAAGDLRAREGKEEPAPKPGPAER